MNDNRQYLKLARATEEAIKGFSGFQQIDQFLDRISHRLEGIDLYWSENEGDLHEMIEFLREIPQIEVGFDLLDDYNDLDAWHNNAMLELFINCATDSERNHGLTSEGGHCRYIFNNADDWDHTSLMTYEYESDWIADIIHNVRDAIADRLNVFYMCTENITEAHIQEDITTIKKWVEYYFYDSFTEEDEQEAQAEND